MWKHLGLIYSVWYQLGWLQWWSLGNVSIYLASLQEVLRTNMCYHKVSDNITALSRYLRAISIKEKLRLLIANKQDQISQVGSSTPLRASCCKLFQ